MKLDRVLSLTRGILPLGAAGAALLLAACGGGSNSGTGNSPAAGGAGSGGGATIGTTQTSAGSVLTGPDGKTLYVLLDSSGNAVACSGSCLAVWPPLTTSGSPQAGSGVSASLATTSAAGGGSQVTADGNPLYYFSQDSAAGQANGQGIMSFGGTWHAVQPNGQPVSAGSSTGSTSSTGGGYGY